MDENSLLYSRKEEKAIILGTLNMQIKEPLKYRFNRSVSVLPFYMIPITTSLDHKVRLLLHQVFLSHLYLSYSAWTLLFPILPNLFAFFFFKAISFLKYYVSILDRLPKQGNKHAMSQTKSAKGSYKDEQTDRLLREMLG